MRRMIPSKLIDWIKNLFNKLIHNDETNTLEVGGNLEVDGNCVVNGGLTCEPVDIAIFGATPTEQGVELPYNNEQILNIINKNLINGFTIQSGSSTTYLKVMSITVYDSALEIYLGATYNTSGSFTTIKIIKGKSEEKAKIYSAEN